MQKKRISPHVLRYSAAMELLQSGVDCAVIALWLGHESVDTTQIYLHASHKIKEQASSDSMKTLAKDPEYIGSDLSGFFGVLHTWGRQLQYHPHIHYIVPGGALSSKNQLWHPSRIDFYLPVRALSKIYKAKFQDLMKKADLYHQIPANV